MQDTPKKIISHGGTPHLDDVLGIALAVKFWREQNRDVEVVRTNEVVDDADNKIFIDIGGRYDGQRYFDHHHDISLESSFLLVLKAYYPDYYEKAKNLQVVQYIDLKDRFGPVEARKQLNLADVKPGIIEGFLSFIVQSVSSIDGYVDIANSFMKYIDREYEKIKIVEMTSVEEVNGYKVAVCKHDNPIVSTIVGGFNPDIIVAKNIRQEGTVSIIKNSNSPKYNEINIDDLAKDFEVVFKHKNGFMKVVKGDLDIVAKNIL